MKAEELEFIKNVPVHQWLPNGTLPEAIMETLDLEFLIEKRKFKITAVWSQQHKGFVDKKTPVDEFRLKHRILEVFDTFYICTQSPKPITVYAFYCGRCVGPGDRDAVLAEVDVNKYGAIQLAMEDVKRQIQEISTIKKTRKIRMY